MNLLNDWISENLLQALGWTLVHSIWQLVIIAAFLWLSLKIFSKRSPDFKYKIALGALGLSFVAASATLIYELSILPSSSGAAVAFENWTQPFFVEGPAESQSFVESLINWIEIQLPLLVNFWFVGAVLFLFRLFNSLSEIKGLKNTSTPCEQVDLLKKLEEISSRFGISKAVQLKVTHHGLSPVTFGFLKPIILIPAGLIFHLSPAQLEAIIAHELAHVKRNDYLINLIQSSLEVVFFYHPCFWWINQTVKELRENAADDLAVSTGIAPKVLAYSLAEVLNFAQQNPPELALAAGKKRNPTLNRIKRIMGMPAQTYPQNPIISIPMLLTLIFSAGLIASAQQDAPTLDEAFALDVTLENPDLGYLDPVKKKAAIVSITQTDTVKKEKKVIHVEGEEPMIWSTEDGDTYVIKGGEKGKYEYRIKGDTLISGKDTVILKGNSAFFFKNGPDFNFSTMPTLELAEAPEMEFFMEAPEMEFEMAPMPEMNFEMAPVPTVEFEMAPMPPIEFEGMDGFWEFEDMDWSEFHQDTVGMTKAEKEKWKKDMKLRAAEIERKAEEWKRNFEPKMKEFEAKMKAWEKENEPRMKEFEAKMKAWEKANEPKMKEFEEKMKAWEKENEPRMKEWEAKMKSWQEAQEPKMKEFEAKMKAWQESQQPKIEEFQRKMEVWQKENAEKLDEFRKKVEAEFKKNQNENTNDN
ncbi:M56 family metallopeptidase [Algoriphagus zhangzhouensis]|uniref:Signal transducer regulating beta-lactamase production, contains metallopeptidase domain n=1 Tax=Algoriphagus zhangzhouensis TaxID=1073327 RepID=A0A1M7Z9M6_9BACT|nr:M56 family metallopeptidase [Algoriphagus zhangzhouensis]TDY47434.1 beta-lactamase regulating signal transducer with metallopeptidase domain [Algoriphagus zhangzhouensis]SHO61490.1 Signal transducer regulating beta-lactamase production, contains metallopeptidase domain [Algoriphagus zhangzhouensis]